MAAPGRISPPARTIAMIPDLRTSRSSETRPRTAERSPGRKQALWHRARGLASGELFGQDQPVAGGDAQAIGFAKMHQDDLASSADQLTDVDDRDVRLSGVGCCLASKIRWRNGTHRSDPNR